MGPWRRLGPRVAHGVPSQRLAIEGWFRSFMITIYLSFWALCLQGDGGLRCNKQRNKVRKQCDQARVEPVSNQQIYGVTTERALNWNSLDELLK